MKKWILSLIVSGITASSIAISEPPEPPASPDYRVFDIRITGAKIIDEIEEETYKIINPGSLVGWVVYDLDTENSTFIELEKGAYSQGESDIYIGDYFSSAVEGDTKYVEKGVMEIWFDLYLYDGDVNIYGVSLGKYIFIESEASSSERVSARGVAAVDIKGDEETLGGCAKNVTFKMNARMSTEINDATSAQEYTETMVALKTKVEEEVDLDWSWNSEG